MKYLDPKNDLTFKKVFGEHPHVLKSFLNAMLPLSSDNLIEYLEYLSPEMVPEIPGIKNSIVDVRCTDKKGRQFIVEMQMLWTESFKQRVVFNASKAYVRQLEKSREFKLLQPVYALSLVNEVFEPEIAEYYHHYQIVNLEHNEKQLEGLEFIFVELPKFKAESINEKKLQVLWLRFLTEIDEKVRSADPSLLEVNEIKEALEQLEVSAYSLDQLEYYDRYWDRVRTEVSFVSDALEKGQKEGMKVGYQNGLKKGIQEGMQKGMHDGLQQGLEQGLEKGRNKERLIIGINALRGGIDADKIVLFTGLSAQDIQKLKGLLAKFPDEAESHLDDFCC